jgi:hypothetical protein
MVEIIQPRVTNNAKQQNVFEMKYILLKFYPIYDLSFTQQSTDDIYQSYVFYA